MRNRIFIYHKLYFAVMIGGAPLCTVINKSYHLARISTSDVNMRIDRVVVAGNWLTDGQIPSGTEVSLPLQRLATIGVRIKFAIGFNLRFDAIDDFLADFVAVGKTLTDSNTIKATYM